MKAALAIANRSSGLPNTRFIGCPIAQDTSTSTGATTSAIWIAEPTHRPSTMSILSARANATAANKSATVPISASTTTPMNTGERPRSDAVSASRADTSSDSNAIPMVPPTTETAMTRAGFEYILTKHVQAAAQTCQTLRNRTVSPHQLRHSCAVTMLQATHDIRKVALWLGHADVRTTEIYLRLDPSEKLEAAEAVVPPKLRRGRFKAPDALITSLFEPADKVAALV